FLCKSRLTGRQLSGLRPCGRSACTFEIHHFLVEVNLGAGQSVSELPLGRHPSFTGSCTDVSKRNAELNVGRFSRILLGIVGGGIGASLDVVIIEIVEGVIIGVGV
nr:hypothetical protein [Tanacetum cinerariifolium]